MTKMAEPLSERIPIPPVYEDELTVYAETCDWGFCNGEPVALRRAYGLRNSRGPEYLPVCAKHLTGDPVLSNGDLP